MYGADRQCGYERSRGGDRGAEGKATEGPGPRTEDWRWHGKLVREGLGTGDTIAELAEAVDSQCVDRHEAVIIATCNVGIGQLHADGRAVLQFIHG
jgi:hypothetical protein